MRHDLFMKMAIDLVRFGSAYFDVWKRSKSMECSGVFTAYIERNAIFIHPFSDFSVNHKNVGLWITIGVCLPFQREGADAKKQTEVNKRYESGLLLAEELLAHAIALASFFIFKPGLSNTGLPEVSALFGFDPRGFGSFQVGPHIWKNDVSFCQYFFFFFL